MKVYVFERGQLLDIWVVISGDFEGFLVLSGVAQTWQDLGLNLAS